MKITYKIIDYKDFISWCVKHDDLRLQIEKLMSIHRDNQPFNIGDFIKENLENQNNIPFSAKIIVLIENKINIIGITRCEVECRDNVVYGYISAVHIKSIHRGKKLCQKMLLLMANSSQTTFELDVNASNFGAIKCYESCGFKITKKKDIGNKEIGYTMATRKA